MSIDDRMAKLAPYMPTSSHEAAAFFNSAKYGLVTFVGASGSGKTTIAQTTMQHVISISANIPSSVQAFTFASAPSALNNANRRKYDSNADDIEALSSVLCLGLDDFDDIDQRDRTLASSILTQRTDNGLVTLLTITSLNNVKMFGTKIVRRVMEGAVIRL